VSFNIFVNDGIIFGHDFLNDLVFSGINSIIITCLTGNTLGEVEEIKIASMASISSS
jgi:hypothetical protein